MTIEYSTTAASRRQVAIDTLIEMGRPALAEHNMPQMCLVAALKHPSMDDKMVTDAVELFAASKINDDNANHDLVNAARKQQREAQLKQSQRGWGKRK